MSQLEWNFYCKSFYLFSRNKTRKNICDNFPQCKILFRVIIYNNLEIKELEFPSPLQEKRNYISLRGHAVESGYFKKKNYESKNLS